MKEKLLHAALTVENQKEGFCNIEISVDYRKIKLNDPRFKTTGEILPLKEEPGFAIESSLSVHLIIPAGVQLSMNSHDRTVYPWQIPEDAYDDLFELVNKMQKQHTLLEKVIGSEYCKIKGTLENPDASSMKAGINHSFGFDYTIFKEGDVFCIKPVE